MYSSRRVLLGTGLPSLLVALCACGSEDAPDVTTTADAGADAALFTDATTSSDVPGDAAADLDSMTTGPVDGASDGGDAGDSGNSTEAGTNITVAGKVVFNRQGVAGATVVIAGQSAVTSATGTFTVAHVSAPYDLSVIVPARQPAVSHWVGLHETNPIIPVVASVTPHSASITGTFSGGAAVPNAAHTGFSLVATSADVFSWVGVGDPGMAASKQFDETLSWSTDDASAQAFLYVLQTTPDTGIPTAYGYAGTYAVPTPLTNGATSANNVVPLTATTDSAVSGTIVLPAGYTLDARHLEVLTMNNGVFDFEDTSASTTFSFATPSAPFITSTNIFVVASSATGDSSSAERPLIPGTSGNIVTVFPPPAPVSPVAAQTGVDPATVFSWTPAGGTHCLYDVRLLPGADGNAELDLVTTSTSVTIPDLSAFGAGLATAATYHWFVGCRSTASAVTIDDAATSAGVTSLGYDTSAARAFTSK